MERRYLTLHIMLLSIAMVSPLTQAENDFRPQSMIVITANAKPLQHIIFVQQTLNSDSQLFKVYNLDGVEEFEKTISQGLPQKEEHAKRVLQQRIETMGRTNFNAQLIAAYQGVFLALKHQINHYPAILFDGTSVIYGVTDLRFALQLYRKWRRDQEIGTDG